MKHPIHPKKTWLSLTLFIVLGLFYFSVLFVTQTAALFDDQEQRLLEMVGRLGVPSFFQEGNGSSTTPFIIRTANQLNNLSKLNATGIFRDDHYFEIDASIDFIDMSDLDTDYLANEISGYEVFSPIGSIAAPFVSHFEGNGKVIKNMIINSDGDDVGLFGYVGPTGIIQNVFVENMYLVSRAPSASTTIGGTIQSVFGLPSRQVINDRDALTLASTSGSSLTLASTGTNGSTITWSSNNHTYILDDGTITYPSAGSVTAIMKAVLSLTVDKVTYRSAKEFTITLTSAAATVSPLASDIHVGFLVGHNDGTLLNAGVLSGKISLSGERNKQASNGLIGFQNGTATNIDYVYASGISAFLSQSGYTSSNVDFNIYTASSEIVNYAIERLASNNLRLSIQGNGTIDLNRGVFSYGEFASKMKVDIASTQTGGIYDVRIQDLSLIGEPELELNNHLAGDDPEALIWDDRFQVLRSDGYFGYVITVKSNITIAATTLLDTNIGGVSLLVNNRVGGNTADITITNNGKINAIEVDNTLNHVRINNSGSINRISSANGTKTTYITNLAGSSINDRIEVKGNVQLSLRASSPNLYLDVKAAGALTLVNATTSYITVSNITLYENNPRLYLRNLVTANVRVDAAATNAVLSTYNGATPTNGVLNTITAYPNNFATTGTPLQGNITTLNLYGTGQSFTLNYPITNVFTFDNVALTVSSAASNITVAGTGQVTNQSTITSLTFASTGSLVNNGTVSTLTTLANATITNNSSRTISTLHLNGGGTVTNYGTLSLVNGNSAGTITNYNVLTRLEVNHTGLSTTNATSGTSGSVTILVYNVPTFSFTNTASVNQLIVNAPITATLNYPITTLTVYEDNVNIGGSTSWGSSLTITNVEIYGDNVVFQNNGAVFGGATISKVTVYGTNARIEVIAEASATSTLNELVIASTSRNAYVYIEAVTAFYFFNGTARINKFEVQAGSFGTTLHGVCGSRATLTVGVGTGNYILNNSVGGLLQIKGGTTSRVNFATPTGTGSLARQITANTTLISSQRGDVIITSSSVTLTIQSGAILSLLRVNASLSNITINLNGGASIQQLDIRSSYANVTLNRNGTIQEFVLNESYANTGKFGSFAQYYIYTVNNVTLTVDNNAASSPNLYVSSGRTGTVVSVTSAGVMGDIEANSPITVNNAGSLDSVDAFSSLTLNNSGTITDRITARGTITPTAIGTIKLLDLRGTTSFNNQGGTIEELWLSTTVALTNNGTIYQIKNFAAGSTITNNATYTIRQIIAYSRVTITNSGVIRNTSNQGSTVDGRYATVVFTDNSHNSTLTNNSGGVVSGYNTTSIFVFNAINIGINNQGSILTVSTAAGNNAIVLKGELSTMALTNTGTIGNSTGSSAAIVTIQGVLNPSTLTNNSGGIIQSGILPASPVTITNNAGGIIRTQSTQSAIRFDRGAKGSTVINNGTIEVVAASASSVSAIEANNAENIVVTNNSILRNLSAATNSYTIEVSDGNNELVVYNSGTISATATSAIWYENMLARGANQLINHNQAGTSAGTLQGNVIFLSFDTASTFNNSHASAIFQGSLTISSPYFSFLHNNNSLTGELILNGDHPLLYSLPTYDVQGGLVIERGVTSLPIFVLNANELTGPDNILTKLSINTEAIVSNAGVIIDWVEFRYQNQATDPLSFGKIFFFNSATTAKLNQIRVQTTDLFFTTNVDPNSTFTFDRVELLENSTYFTDLGQLGYNIGTLVVGANLENRSAIIIGPTQTITRLEIHSESTVTNRGTLGSIFADDYVIITNSGTIQNTSAAAGAIEITGANSANSSVTNLGTIHSSLGPSIYYSFTEYGKVTNSKTGVITNEIGATISFMNNANGSISNLGSLSLVATTPNTVPVVSIASSPGVSFINEGSLYSLRSDTQVLVDTIGSTTTMSLLNESTGRIGVLPANPSTLFAGDFLRIGAVTAGIQVTNKGWVYGNLNFTQTTTGSKFDNSRSTAVFIGALTIRSTDTNFFYSIGESGQNRITTLHLYANNYRFLQYVDFTPEILRIYSSVTGTPTLSVGENLTIQQLIVDAPIVVDTFASLQTVSFNAAATLNNGGTITTLHNYATGSVINNVIYVQSLPYYGTIATVNLHGSGVIVNDPNNGVGTIIP